MKNGSLNSRQEELEEYDPHIITSFNGKWIIKFSLGRGQDTPIQVWTKNSNKKEEAIIKINKIFYAKVLETFGSRAGDGLYHIKLSSRDTGGQVCKKLPKIMLRSVINVKSMPQIFISLEGS